MKSVCQGSFSLFFPTVFIFRVQKTIYNGLLPLLQVVRNILSTRGINNRFSDGVGNIGKTHYLCAEGVAYAAKGGRSESKGRSLTLHFRPLRVSFCSLEG